MTRQYGWTPDLPDPRDYILEKKSLIKKLVTFYPEELDLEPTCSDVEDQTVIGSCIAHGCVGSMEQIDRTDDDKWTELSRLFGYWILREDKEHDTGGQIRDAIKAIAKYGICDEKLWPYDTNKFAVEPSFEAFHNAKKRKNIEYYRIADDNRYHGIMSTLVEERRLVIFGFTVFRNFEIPFNVDSAVLLMPTTQDLKLGVRGGHCIDIVGYKYFVIDGVKKLFFKCRNSYGKNWGINGYFWMEAEYIFDKNLCDDFWVITKVSFLKGDEPYDPIPSNAKWYIPVTSIVKGIVEIWKRIFGGK